MKTVHRIFAIASVMALTAGAAASAQTVQELVDKNIEAKGGYEAIESIESARINGTMAMGGMEMPFTMEWKEPNKLRMEFTLQGMTGIQAYDGETGWMVMPFMGKTEPEKMSADDATTLEEQADFRGVLFDYEKKGNKVEYLGEEEVEGTPTYKLKVTRASGDEAVIYLDKDYYLEIRQEGKTKVQGQEMESEVTIGDYKEVDGVMFAHSMEMSANGMPGGQTMTFDQIELNVDISDDRFTMPETAGDGEAEGDAEGGTAR